MSAQGSDKWSSAKIRKDNTFAQKGSCIRIQNQNKKFDFFLNEGPPPCSSWLLSSHYYLLNAGFDLQEGKYAVVTDRWQKFTDVYLDEKILEFLACYADEFLIHGVDVEGKR